MSKLSHVFVKVVDFNGNVGLFTMYIRLKWSQEV